LLNPTWFYKQELFEVPGVLTAVFITYDGLKDDSREIRNKCSWDEFVQRVTICEPDWDADEAFMRELGAKKPEFVFAAWLRRTIFVVKLGQRDDLWTEEKAANDVLRILTSTAAGSGTLIQEEVAHLREIVPPGAKDFHAFEHMVRVVFNFLFRGELGEGKAQSRTEPEDEGIEIRDLVFANQAEAGFWNDLKVKYSASEIVVDAKNKDEITRDDLRQLYCYLKPALGFWGFIVCRSAQPPTMNAFNRTLCRNFEQRRGVLILCDDDLRRMVQIKMHGQSPATYLQECMSTFIRSI
jgi:hypothetical protein